MDQTTLFLFKELKNLLTNEETSEIDYIMDGINTCISLLENVTGDTIPKEIITIHKSFYPPHGGLSDFFIWRDDFDERETQNRELEKIKKELWDRLEA